MATVESIAEISAGKNPVDLRTEPAPAADSTDGSRRNAERAEGSSPGELRQYQGREVEDPLAPAVSQGERELTAASSRQALAEKALAAWLRWNSVYEQVTAAMFDRRANLQELQNTLDLSDEIRQYAMRLTQELFGP
jgi:hypothetical protein